MTDFDLAAIKARLVVRRESGMGGYTCRPDEDIDTLIAEVERLTATLANERETLRRLMTNIAIYDGPVIVHIPPVPAPDADAIARSSGATPDPPAPDKA